ncbi:MAG: UbiA family prenyltransferase [Candidatus Micrarchaeota archaeon]|nr:UbiA family prenyltransferase [Candidatus Micrarchaeota archaeon]
MGKVIEILKLTRIEHSAMLVFAVIAAEFLAGGLPQLPVLVLSLITPVFISMGSFAINDYFDIEVDRKNGKIHRPLVRGTISPIGALFVADAAMTIGIGASIPLGANALLIALVFAILSIAYSWKLKEILLLGNVYIAFTMVIPFIYGSYVVSQYVGNAAMLVSVMVFFSGLAREIHGTIRDYKGDRERGVASLPQKIGVRNAAAVAAALYLIAILMSAYLFIYTPPFMLNPAYGIIIAVSDFMLAYAACAYMKEKHTAKEHSRLRNVSLLGMGIAILAILVSAALPHI